MYRVLLVDDELEIRSGLKLKIDWPSLQYVIAGEAQDGREALGLLEREHFDLILTDIRMPMMSGLELLKQCAENYPQIKVIVLSGHDDFHYLKAAMQCGARDYLLKPVVRSELTHILGKLREEFELEQRQTSEKTNIQHQLQKNHSLLQEQLLLEYVCNDDEDKETTLRNEAHRLGMAALLNDRNNFCFISVEFRIPKGRLGEQPQGIGLFRLAFQLICRETVQDPLWKNHVFAFFHRSYPQMMHFLVCCSAEEGAEQRVHALCKRLEEYIQRYLRVESVIGVGMPIKGLKGLRQGFLSALLAWSQSQSGPVSQIVTSNRSYDADFEMLPVVEKRLELALENGDLSGFTRTLESIVESGRYPMHGVASFVLRVILLLDQAGRKHNLDIPETQEWMFTETMWRVHSEAAALTYLTGMASRVIEGIRNSRVTGGVETVEAIRKYIDECYMNELSLTMLADRFHINATYLSELFKKYSGITFSDYVTQVRIGRAAELLLAPHMRLSDIAELVGFANASYLSSVFKKHYGVSPNEYRSHPTQPLN